MRFYLVALLALSATLYVADAGLPDVLIERARAIIAKAEADLKIIHGQGYQHLTRQVQAEIEKVRQLEIELQKLEKTKEVDPAKELEIENRLLAHENTLILEILKVQQIIQEEVRGKTAEALIAHAQGLIAHAEADLKRHKESGHVVAQLESEILALHHLVRELETLEKGKHVPPEQVFHIEIRMLVHENRLEVEVLRLDHEHKSMTPKLPDILIKRAQAIILRAEIDIHHHKGKGRLTHLMEEEVKKVRQTEMELLLLEHEKHLDTELAYHVEMALLQHEYFLIEESLRLELEPVHKPAARVGDLPEELIKRARAILIQAEHDLQFIHGQGYEHLTREVRSEIEKVRQFEKELQKLDQSKHIDPEKQLELENRLLAHENTLILEILKVEQIIQEEVRGKTAEALIAHAQGLIAHAEADLKRHKESGHVVEALEHEIKALHSLVKELETLEKGKHVPPERVFHVEIRMLYHENRLELEVLRLDQEHKSLTPKLPDILIKRAQAIILRAEIDIHRHKGKGRLTHLMEEEVHKVRAIEMELLLLEHDKHLDTKKGFETEMALLQHEYFLIEESLRLELEPVPAPGGATRVAGLPDVLIQRARAIIAKAEQDLQFIHGQGYAHLTREVQAEVQKVRELEKELIAMDQSKHIDPAKELELENRLLAHENTLILEILKVEQIIQEEVRGKTAEALIAGAQAIIKHAEADLKRHKEAGHVVEQIEHEIKALHELVKELETLEKGKHVPPEKVFEVEIRMLTHANHLSMEVLVLDHQHKELSPRLPEALIQTARAIILRAEIDIHRHKGRGKLVHVMEAEVSHVRALEVELLLLEKGKHVDTQKGFEIELALLQHEYNLLEESLRLELDPSVIVEKSAAPEPTLPEVLIKRAREIIARSEEDIKVYHGKGLKHLTQAMEEEIERVRELERELIKLDQAKHIDPAKVLEYETRLLQHENRLLAEALKVEDAIRAEEQGKLPEELIKAAEVLIKATEEFIAKHKLQGHLVDAIEAELKVLHGLAQELQALEKGKHVPPKVVFEYELRLLTHENKLVTEELILDHQHHLLPKKLPEALIHRAQAIIRKAEYDLERHRKAGHLVFRMEEEIHKVRALEKELLLLEKAKHVDEEKAFEVEMTLLKHENFLLVESIEMEHGRNGVRNHHVH